MKALNLHAVGDLRYEDVPMPVRQAGEVLLKVHACGICGSDLPRVFTKGTYHFPTIPGHEFAGEIVEADDPSLVGRRAAVFPLLPCRKCEACQVGEYAQCSDYDYYGSRRDGAFAEYIAVKEWNLVFFDDSLSYEEAAMCEPAAVALHAIGQASVGIGDTVAVFGAGPIGIMLGLWARTAGAFRVILCDIDPTKVEFARKQGFDAVNSRETDPVEYIRTQTGGRGADACIEGAGVAQGPQSGQKFRYGRLDGQPRRRHDPHPERLLGDPAQAAHAERDVEQQLQRRPQRMAHGARGHRVAPHRRASAHLAPLPALGGRQGVRRHA